MWRKCKKTQFGFKDGLEIKEGSITVNEYCNIKIGGDATMTIILRSEMYEVKKFTKIC